MSRRGWGGIGRGGVSGGVVGYLGCLFGRPFVCLGRVLLCGEVNCGVEPCVQVFLVYQFSSVQRVCLVV